MSESPSSPAPTWSEVWATPGIGGKASQTIAWYRGTRMGRALERYSTQRGSLLAGGIAYTAIFSLTAALTLGWTIFVSVLGDNEALRGAVVEAVNDTLPGLFTEGGTDGLVDPDSLVISGTWTVTGVIALVVMLVTATGLIGAVRSAITAMFGILRLPENMLRSQARNLLGLVLLAVSIIATAALSIAVSDLGGWLFTQWGLDGSASRVWISVASVVVAWAIDMALLIVIVRYVSGVRVPRRDLLWGAALGAVAAGALRLLGTSVVGTVDGPILTAATTLVTLFLWINLLARVVVMMAAWMANPPAAPAAPEPADEEQAEQPNYATHSVPATLDRP